MKRACYLLALCLALAGCSSEESGPLLGSLELAVSLEAPVEVKATATRAVDADLQLEIRSGDGTTLVRQFAPGAFANRLTLEAGSYLLKAFTPNYTTSYSDSELGEAKYYAEKSFTIEADAMNRVSCSVPMINTAVSFTLPNNFNTIFSSYSFTIKQQTTQRNVTLTAGATAYFDCTASEADLLYTLMTINSDNEPHSDSGNLTAKAGTLYHITYDWQTRSLNPTQAE